MHSPQLRLARTLFHEWRMLPAAERGRLAPLAREVKDLALDLRGAADAHRAQAELTLANEAFATAIIDAAERCPDLSDAEFEGLRNYVRAEQYRAALPRAA